MLLHNPTPGYSAPVLVPQKDLPKPTPATFISAFILHEENRGKWEQNFLKTRGMGGKLSTDSPTGQTSDPNTLLLHRLAGEALSAEDLRGPTAHHCLGPSALPSFTALHPPSDSDLHPQATSSLAAALASPSLPSSGMCTQHHPLPRTPTHSVSISVPSFQRGRQMFLKSQEPNEGFLPSSPPC